MTDPGARRRPQLGRGLSALFGDADPAAAEAVATEGVRSVPIEAIFANPAQPRRRFADVELAELARSIRERGIVQPLLVRPRPTGVDGAYEIVAGERRWRAAQQVQLHEVPVVVRALDDAQSLQLSIIENVQRQDLSCLEEAAAYRRLVSEFGHTQEEIAGIVGKSRSHVANSLRLLNLPAAVQQFLEDGRLSAGHGRALLSVDDPAALAVEVVRRGLSVRQTEALAQQQRDRHVAPTPVADPPTVRPVAKAREDRAGTSGPADSRDPFDHPTPPGQEDPFRRPLAQEDATALQRSLSEELGMRVRIDMRAAAAGSLSIDFRSLEQLDVLLARLSPPIPFSG